MIKRNESYHKETHEKMRGGVGSVTIETLLTPEELYENGRLYAILTLEPGSSIGFHVHNDEMESYYIISGQAEYVDDTETVNLFPGDTTLTPAGQGHSIKSVGSEPLKFLAQILYQ